MGFPCRKLNGEIVDIVEKSIDRNGAEVFTAADGTLYTRATSDGGDMHALVDYTSPGDYVERDDSDLEVRDDDEPSASQEPQEANDGPSQGDVDSTAVANADAAPVPGGPTFPDGSVVSEQTGSDDDNGGETLPAA